MSQGIYVAYYRVSTEKQAKRKGKETPAAEARGLGLAAQRAAVTAYLSAHGGQLVEEYTEIESGKKNDRPELLRALDRCQRLRAVLIIAKLDRLARSVHFISGLMESGVQFVAADMPNATDFMLHIYAAVAQEERRLISLRTKVALAAAKETGVQLGNPRIEELNERHRSQADAFALRMSAVLNELKAEGFMTIEAIRDELNSRQIPTARNGRWHLPTVHKLMKRVEKLASVSV